MEKYLAQGYSPEQRRQFLADNCNRTEEMGYMKPFSEEEIATKKDELAEVDITIDKIEDQKKEANANFTAELKPLKTERKALLDHIKNRAEHVTERCFVFFDEEERKVGWYNEEGMLVNSRPMRPGEYQRGLPFSVNRGLDHPGKTGTDH